MERNSKHGARLDDAMSGETQSLTRASHESRVEEWREAEPAGEDQPTPDVLVSGDLRGPVDSPAAVPHDELEARSTLATHLRTSVWPADRSTLETVATEENAPAWVLGLLRRLPEGREYVNVADVWSAAGGRNEQARA